MFFSELGDLSIAHKDHVDTLDQNKEHLYVLKFADGCQHRCHEMVKRKLQTTASRKSHFGIINADHSLVHVAPRHMEVLSRGLSEYVQDFAPVLPQFKISHNLNGVWGQSVDCDLSTVIDLHIVLMPVDSADLEKLKDTVSAAGAEWDIELTIQDPQLLRPRDRESACSVQMPVCHVDKVVASLTGLSFVQWVERRGVMRPHNKWAIGIVQTGEAKENRIFDQGLTGKGYVVGVADTGIDPNSCFFRDEDYSFPYNTLNSAHRKVVYYDTYQGSEDEDGHGTAVSGTVAGYCTEADGLEDYNGGAPDSKIAFFDIGRPDGSLRIPPDANSDLFVPLYNAGAVIQSMSWGSASSGYDMDARYTRYTCATYPSV